MQAGLEAPAPAPSNPRMEPMAGTRLRARLAVRPGTKTRLDAFEPSNTYGHTRDEAERELAEGLQRLSVLQDRLWAEAKHAVLVVLQGMDAAGKDGTIRHVMGAFNPQGCRVTSFKVPSAVELAHDYLWRVHQHVPAQGRDRRSSTARTTRTCWWCGSTNSCPRTSGRSRYAQINDFERMLTEAGTIVVKFFLYIDRDEQRERFQARLDDPTKRWKFQLGDLEERQSLGRLPRRLRGGDRADVIGPCALVSSSPPTGSGSATSLSPRSWPTSSKISTRRTRSPRISRPTW